MGPMMTSKTGPMMTSKTSTAKGVFVDTIECYYYKSINNIEYSCNCTLAPQTLSPLVRERRMLAHADMRARCHDRKKRSLDLYNYPEVLKSAADLPGEGTGLPKIYRNIEYRLMRLATFQHTDDAGKAAAKLRSLEKLACADWCEQGPDWAHERAVQVRSLHTGVVL